ncbi:metal-dependent transcriptional regulator [Agromyces lapidis]|uniref:Manganese transport regulator n=1 Tax=Agromyces lapidis TaxID=279574 RepID=A0ABV5SL53_9MICO|nr:metal-dependent transcriptional regulator [Agromyces lapidis]
MPASKNPAIEDYLKTVYSHTEWQPDPITPSQLAGKLGVAPSSVTEMVKKMAAQGLVAHVPYGPLRLTDEGRERAIAVVRRHRLIETWLVREMGYGWDEVHDEAEVLEHALSDRLLEQIDLRLGRPSRDPHGDAIPAADGTIQVEPFLRLDGAPAGHAGRVLRISDRDPEGLRALAAAGIAPGVGIEVENPDASGERVLIRLAPHDDDLDGGGDAAAEASPIELTAEAAAEIWVTG